MSGKILGAILLLSLLLVLSIFFMYRGVGWPFGVQGIEALGVFALLLVINLALFLFGRRSLVQHGYSQKSVMLGLFAGLLWLVEICMNNILQPGLPGRDLLDDLFWLVIALIILVASMRFTYVKNRLRTGIVAGFWSGISSGAVACLTALLFIVVGMQSLLSDPLNITEWAARGATSGTPNMAVYFAYQTLAGAILHLVVLGAIMGIVLGVLGGILGKFWRAVSGRMEAKGARV